MDEKILKIVHLIQKHLLQVFSRRVSTKRYRIFRFCVHFTNQEGDFYGVFPFLVPGVSET